MPETILAFVLLFGIFALFMLYSGTKESVRELRKDIKDFGPTSDNLKSPGQKFEELKSAFGEEIEKGELSQTAADELWRLGNACRYSDNLTSARCFELLAISGYERSSEIFREILIENPSLQKLRFDALMRRAKTGDGGSMYAVYKMLREGLGTMKNFEEAAQWLMSSAYKGNLRAVAELANEYLAGGLFSINPIEALAWRMTAKALGDLNSDMHITGLEKLLPVEAQIAAQNRARQIAETVKAGTGVPVAASPSTPASPAPSKPASQPRGSGSGAIVSKSGHVVTAQHVIKGAGYVEVVTPSGTYPAKVLFADEANDLAVLKVDQSFDRHLNVLHSRSIRLGAKVSTIGFPNIGLQGHSPKATEGVISSDLGFQNDVRMWQVSVPIQPGNSGGPLLDEAGHVVGVVVASLSLNAVKVTGAVPQNVNYAIKSAYLEPMLGGCQVDLIQTPVAEARRLEDIMESARQASVLILTY